MDQNRDFFLKMIADLLATPGGQRLAQNYKQAQDAGVAGMEWAGNAPVRTYERAMSPKPLSEYGPMDVIEGGVDAALTAGGIYGLGRTGANVIKDVAAGGKNWVRPMKKPLDPNAPDYTGRHKALAETIAERMMGDPNVTVTRRALADALEEGFTHAQKVKGWNKGPDRATIEQMAGNFLNRVPTTAKFETPEQVMRAVQMGAKPTKNPKAPLTLGIGGTMLGDLFLHGEGEQ